MVQWQFSSFPFPVNKTPILVRWLPPPIGTFKVNFDTSIRDGKATLGMSLEIMKPNQFKQEEHFYLHLRFYLLS